MVVGGAMLPSSYEKDQQDVVHSHRQQAPDEPTTGATSSTANGHQPTNSTNFIYLLSVLSAMGSFMFGYDTGIVSGAMVFVKKTFHMTSVWQEVTVSSTILGAWALSLYSGSLSDRYGRKPVILWASVVFALASVIMGAAWGKWILLFGRLMAGVAIGLASSVIPMYIAEVAPSKMRGSLVTLNNVAITVGQLVAAVTAGAFSYDRLNGWRWMLGLAAAPAIMQFVGFLFMPESPRWLIKVRRDDEALEALKLIRGAPTGEVMREFDGMRQNHLELKAQDERRKQQRRNIIVAIFRKTATRQALYLGCLLMACQQLAGINTVMYYTATIIEMSGVRSDSMAVWLAVPTAVVYVIFGILGFFIADRFGRRTITLTSLMGVIVALMILGSGFQLTAMKGAVVTHHNMSESEVCYTKLDCHSCVVDPKCGFCYDPTNLAVASCLQRDPDVEGRSLGGECAHLAGLGSIAAASSAASGGSSTSSSSMAGGGGSPLLDSDPRFVFTTHVCPTVNQGIAFNTWLVLIGMILYLAAFAPGMSPMPWTINSEIYPMWARSFCYSIATSVNWFTNLFTSLAFISLTEVLTTHGVFYMYAILSSVFWLVLFWKLPETRGRSLEDISSMFGKTKSEDQLSMEAAADEGASQSGGSSVSVANVGLRPNQTPASQRHDNLAFVAGDAHLGAPLGKPLDKSAPSAASEGQLARHSAQQVQRALGTSSPAAAAPAPAEPGASISSSQPDLQRTLEDEQQ